MNLKHAIFAPYRYLKKMREDRDVKDQFKVTQDTSMAVYHTSRNVRVMCEYLLDRYGDAPWNLRYLLLGKFQSDMLESHFGHMRKLCGSNYWTTVRNFLQSEAIIRKTNMLWYSGYDIAEVQKEMSEASRTASESDADVVDFILDRLFASQSEELHEPTSDAKPALGHISGYLAHQVTKMKSCEDCKRLLVDSNAHFTAPVFDETEVNEQYLFITQTLNRGGLKAPTMFAVSVTILITKLWRFVLSHGDLKCRFMSSLSSRKVFQQVVHGFLSAHEEYLDCTCANGHKFNDELLPSMTRTLFNCFGSNLAKEAMSEIHRRKAIKSYRRENCSERRQKETRKRQKLQSERD